MSTPRRSTWAFHAEATEILNRAANGLPVSVEVGETGRATLVFRMDWRLARRVLIYCRALGVVADFDTDEENTPPVMRTDLDETKTDGGAS